MISLELSFRQICDMLYEEKIQRSITLIISIIYQQFLGQETKFLRKLHYLKQVDTLWYTPSAPNY